jgi:UPF0042 nucleotide-binding protein
MNIVVTSFSFKRGIPDGANMVFDVRFLKNPFYDPALTALSGVDEAVGAHIDLDPIAATFFTQLTQMMTLLLPRFAESPRETFTIAIGCTGGQHRSVYMTQKLGAFLKNSQYKVSITHRDLGV